VPETSKHKALCSPEVGPTAHADARVHPQFFNVAGVDAEDDE
jgi:hypothetical protein